MPKNANGATGISSGKPKSATMGNSDKSFRGALSGVPTKNDKAMKRTGPKKPGSGFTK